MDLLLQLQADQLGVPVTRPTNQETTALGSAYMAGLAEGFWGSTADVTASWEVDATMSPNPDRARQTPAMPDGNKPSNEAETGANLRHRPDLRRKEGERVSPSDLACRQAVASWSSSGFL